MFTGIIEGTGRVMSIGGNTGRRSAMRMTVHLGRQAEGLKVGQSVALNGVCLTVTGIDGETCGFEMIQETAERTSLGSLREGSMVNVERSLEVGGRLEGHFVLGHVDGTGTITEVEEEPEQVKVWFRIPDELAGYVVRKGSIAVDGVSLTVVDKRGSLVSVCLIPHTIQATNFAQRRRGDKINIETDILGKYALGRDDLQI